MYQRQLEGIIEQIRHDNMRPSLLIHACCAPCSSYVLEYLIPYFSITVYYYNPNIAPAEEFEFRLSEEKRLIDELPGAQGIKVVSPPYDHREFLDKISGLESEPEGGRRCAVCFRQRLESTAAYAAEHGYDYYTTTLTISPLKNAHLLNEIGNELGERYDVRFLPSDFKKRNGFKRSIDLSKQYTLYRQDYCGCEFSKAERKAKKSRDSASERKI